MSQYTVGKDVLSYCSKCKLTLSHTIVAMKDPSTIAKVKCNTCKALHAYKSPGTKTAKVKSKSIIPGAKKKSISISDLWEQEMTKTQRKSRAYSIRETFEVGDVIDHKKFGPGIVQNFTDGNIEVLFRFEIKTLVHGK